MMNGYIDKQRVCKTAGYQRCRQGQSFLPDRTGATPSPFVPDKLQFHPHVRALLLFRRKGAGQGFGADSTGI
jgi:hypothetical protein